MIYESGSEVKGDSGSEVEGESGSEIEDESGSESGSEGHHVCAICKSSERNYDDHKVYFTCSGYCQRAMCGDCDTAILAEGGCELDNCDRCEAGSCYNDSILARYCSDCCPQDVLDEIDERKVRKEAARIENIRIESTKAARRDELIEKLQKRGLELRSDSKYCKLYIDHDKGDPDTIVNRMFEVAILYKNGMSKMLDIVGEEHAEEIAEGYRPDLGVFEEAEERILTQMANKSRYP